MQGHPKHIGAHVESVEGLAEAAQSISVHVDPTGELEEFTEVAKRVGTHVDTSLRSSG